MAKAVKKHVKADIKPFLSSPLLQDFSILFQIFCPGFWLPSISSDFEKFKTDMTYMTYRIYISYVIYVTYVSYLTYMTYVTYIWLIYVV